MPHDALMVRLIEISERRSVALGPCLTAEDVDRVWIEHDEEGVAAANDLYPDRDYLRMTDIRAVERAAKEAGRPIYNGCTGEWLRERYGDVVRHHMGVGWYLVPAGQLSLFGGDAA